MAALNGTSGVDLFIGSPSSDTFNFATNQLLSVDVLKGRGAADELRLLTGSSGINVLLLTASNFTNVHGIEQILVEANVLTAHLTISNALVSRSGWVDDPNQDYDMEFTARSGADVIDFTAVGSAYTIFADTGTGDGSADAKIVLEEYTGHANVGPLTAADFILQDCRVIAFRTDAAHAGHTWQ